jgi:hypothetical protein
MDYPNKLITVGTLLDAARKAAMESSAEHPEDIVAAMVGALDGAASAIWYLHKRNEQVEEMGG